MSMLLCFDCDQLFDTDEQVEADYDTPLCEDCLYEQQNKNWWIQQDQDDQWIHDNSQ